MVEKEDLEGACKALFETNIKFLSSNQKIFEKDDEKEAKYKEGDYVKTVVEITTESGKKFDKRSRGVVKAVYEVKKQTKIDVKFIHLIRDVEFIEEFIVTNFFPSNYVKIIPVGESDIEEVLTEVVFYDARKELSQITIQQRREDISLQHSF